MAPEVRSQRVSLQLYSLLSFDRVDQGIIHFDRFNWRSEFDTPDTQYGDFFETWLRICKNISQSGRPVTLFGAGAGVPENIETCVERRYFTEVHYLALVCSDDVLQDRLLTRPAWRGSQKSACNPSALWFFVLLTFRWYGI